ncbi:MAG: hypothetical protein HKN29_03965 [Rhodothermales bacterium]|nr:hypothetical protein [Rhodothermales bacterium]
MSHWYQVFDDEHVNRVTRAAARRHALGAAALGLFSGAVLVASVMGAYSIFPAVLVVAGAWGWAGAALYRYWSRIRRQVWCVKISDREVVGYDYRRKRIRIDWIAASSVDVRRDGLLITADNERRLEVPAGFPEFTALSQAVVEQAEFYVVPILIDGAPLNQVELDALFPFLGALDPDEPA